jgi:hypothetical protein
VTALTNGNYVVRSPIWDNGSVVNAGAVTWGDGATGVTGLVSVFNSLLGEAASTNLQPVVADNVNETFFGRFLAEGGGRAQVGPLGAPTILSLVDLPDDPGGWLRLSFARSISDNVAARIRVTAYGVWRRLPGTPAAAPGRAGPGPSPVLEASEVERLRAALPPELEAREVEGRLYVIGPSGGAGIAAVFPPGTWELVGSVPALQRAEYLAAVPTISDAAANEYVVTAHLTPTSWFVSAPASGQSVNNLASADVGSGSPVAFALEGARPNPARGSGLRVAFALPEGGAARLELMDVSGRRVRSREVGGLGAGRHTVDLSAGRPVAPGLYWVRLTQGGNRGTTRVAVIE